MKSQDIGLLLKLVALRRNERDSPDGHAGKGAIALPNDWRDWTSDDADFDFCATSLPGIKGDQPVARYSVRGLAEETGISKSQVSLALQRSEDVGMVRKDRQTGVPRANTRALFNFIVHGVRYVFPAKSGELTRGIATAFARC
jgi:hypothetical protein